MPDARSRSNSLDLESELDHMLDTAGGSPNPNNNSWTTSYRLGESERTRPRPRCTTITGGTKFKLGAITVNIVPTVVITCLGMLLILVIAHTQPTLLRLPQEPVTVKPTSSISGHDKSLYVNMTSTKDYPILDRVLIRPSTLTEEGIGSLIQRIRGSILLAEHVADATFLLGEKISEHNYMTSHALNHVLYEPVPHLLPIGKTCVLSHYIQDIARRNLLEAVCANKVGSAYWNSAEELSKQLKFGDQLRQQLAPCRIIIDDIYDELYEDLNGCSRKLLRSRLGGITTRRAKGGPEGTRALSDDMVRVGVHIRWGDSANPDPQTVEQFRGSMDVSNMNRVLADLTKLYGKSRLDIIIAMENHDKVLLGRLTDVGAYRLVDSGDGLADLMILADNDILLLGSSSYGVLGHILAAPAGLAIVEGLDEAGKYRDTMREVVYMEDYSKDSFKSLGQRIPALKV